MKLKLDENLSRHLKPALTGLGHDVLTAADEGLLSRIMLMPWFASAPHEVAAHRYPA